MTKRSDLLTTTTLLLTGLALAACGGAQPPAVVNSAPVASGGPDGPWLFHMHRHARVGQHHRVRGTGLMGRETTATTNGQNAGRESVETRASYEVDETVHAVNQRGRATELEWVVQRFDALSNNAPSVTLRQGARLLIHRGPTAERSTATLDGAPLSEAQRAALEVAVEFTAEERSDFDALGDPPQAQAVGGRWPLDGELARRAFATNAGMQATLAGEFELAGRVRVAGVDCLDVRGTMRGSVSSLPNLPPGFTLQDGRLELTSRSALPLDPSLPELHSVAALRMEATLGATRNGVPMTVHVVTRKEQDEVVVSR